MLLSKGFIVHIPSITEDEINHKSKEDTVVKLLALTQVLHLIIQLLVRKVYCLHTTQLETAVLGFSLCAAITYLLWPKKPKDIQLSTNLYITRDLTKDDRLLLSFLNRVGFFKNTVQAVGYTLPNRTVPNHCYSMVDSDTIMKMETDDVSVDSEDAGFILGGVVFGASHCIAWSFSSPSLIEHTLWRVCGVYTTVSIPIYYLCWYIPSKFRSFSRTREFQRAFMFVFYILYVLCRLFILVEMIRSLF
ncbi:hypothetical protein B0T14DRAFT_254595 [Immersiella caudata]|uniref:Uncharacterized protein n=1 Tax=Immersiella caudata TaxID=314043 RepID=A0AA40BX32_9PEZI|nr:hypothetical protein B0T14DRAFT_254595 [Immersiella caudata]